MAKLAGAGVKHREVGRQRTLGRRVPKKEQTQFLARHLLGRPAPAEPPG
jgi:hypothetical protein